MGNDASKPTMTLTSLRPKSRKLAKESIGKKEEEKEKEEERKSNGNQDQPKSREDIWEDYFNDDASRMSIINTDRYADSDQDINEINKLENTVEKADLPSSQRSTFAMLTEDSLMLVRSVQKIKFLSEQLYDHYGRGNAPEDEDILDIIKMIDSMPLSDPTPETDVVVMTKPPAHDDNTTVTTDDRVSSGESDDSGKGDFENNEKKNNTTTTAETTTTAPASEVVLHDAINNTQAHEEIGKSVSICSLHSLLIFYNYLH